MKVYLAGPIFGCEDKEAKEWRSIATAYLDTEVLNPMDRDYRGREDAHAQAIVLRDKEAIKAADTVLVMASRPSWGTAMEVLYASDARKWIIAVVPEGAPVSPWLRYHVDNVVPTLVAAIKMINSIARGGTL